MRSPPQSEVRKRDSRQPSNLRSASAGGRTIKRRHRRTCCLWPGVLPEGTGARQMRTG